MSLRVALMLTAEQCAILVEALEVYEVWEYNADQKAEFPALQAEVSRTMERLTADKPSHGSKDPGMDQYVKTLKEIARESDGIRSKTGVCTIPCGSAVDCRCTPEDAPRTVRKVIRRRKKS